MVTIMLQCLALAGGYNNTHCLLQHQQYIWSCNSLTVCPSDHIYLDPPPSQGGHHPGPEVGAGSEGSRHLQRVETHLGSGDDQDLSHHDQTEAWSGLASLLSQERD